MSTGKAEVVILEGTATIRNGAVQEAFNLLRNGQANCMVIALHICQKKGQLFAIQEDYPKLLKEKFKALGLKEKQLKILIVPINDHPITLTEARFVVGPWPRKVSTTLFCSPKDFMLAEAGRFTSKKESDSLSQLGLAQFSLISEKITGGAKKKVFGILLRSLPSSYITWVAGIFLAGLS
jgi:hypothetical protein